MKKLSLFAALLLPLFFGSCKEGQHDHDHHHGDHSEISGGNEALYREVMEIHDEVMPKMNDMHRIKSSLKKELADNPGLPESVRKAKESLIVQLDSAGEGMMDWMRKFDPPTDSSEAFIKTYLEGEMVRVQKVRDDILNALEEADKQSVSSVAEQ